jgi:hypothetical protein
MQDQPFKLISADEVSVGLPQLLLMFINMQAALVVSTLNNPNASGYARLCYPVNPHLDDDDPLVRLERQMSMETLCELAQEAISKEIISLKETEAVLQVLTMASAIRAHVLGLYGDELPEDLSEQDRMYFQISSALQCCAVVALDEELLD